MKPIHIKSLQKKSRHLRSRRISKDTYIVESVTNPMASHVVTIQFDHNHRVHARCTCRWATYNGVACTHVIAALQHMADLKGRKLSFWLTEQEAERQKHKRFYLEGPLGNDGIWITSRAA